MNDAATPTRPRTQRPAGRPHVPWALSRHDLVWGAAVLVLSVGMFVVTPVLAVLRRLGVVNLDWGWIFLPAILCVAAVFLHGTWELLRALRSAP